LTATPKAAPAPLRRVDARMINGLPEPQSPEALAWMRDTLEALQAADPRPDVDLGGIEARLQDLEARLTALEARPEPDLSALWEALALLRKRLDVVEEGAFAPQPAPAGRDALDPLSWSSLDAAKAGLEVLVTREAARRCGHAVELYELMVKLDALGDQRTEDEDLQLLQHHSWARERQAVELARLEHNQRIRRLDDLAAALTYPWRAHWPPLDSAGA
jgi:hypothetical protein